MTTSAEHACRPSSQRSSRETSAAKFSSTWPPVRLVSLFWLSFAVHRGPLQRLQLQLRLPRSRARAASQRAVVLGDEPGPRGADAPLALPPKIQKFAAVAPVVSGECQGATFLVPNTRIGSVATTRQCVVRPTERRATGSDVAPGTRPRSGSCSSPRLFTRRRCGGRGCGPRRSTTCTSHFD